MAVRAEPTAVRVSVMDSRRPALVVVLPAAHLGVVRRAWRTLGRLLLVTGGSLLALNLAILAVPFPTIHLCTVPLAVMAGPVAAWWAWRTRALLGAAQVHCPRCGEGVAVPERLPGWPARVGCAACGILVELNPA